MVLKRNDESPEEYERREAEELDAATPHSREDEHYLIGVSLKSDRAALEIASRLSPEDFYTPIAYKAFRAIVALTDRGEGVTLFNLTLEIKRQLPEEEQDNPFEALSTFELQAVFDKEEYRDERSINPAIARLKELQGYRVLIASSKRVLAEAYRRTPLAELLAIYEETGLKIMRAGGDTVVHPEQAVRRVNHLYDMLAEGNLTTLPTGYPELNRLLWGGGFWGGDNIVVAGETSTGKTTLALNIFTDAALAGKRGLYFSLEMAYEMLLIRIHSRLARVPAWKIRPNMDNFGEGIRERLRQTIGLVDRLPIFWEDKIRDIRGIRRKSKEYVRNEGIDLIVLDYLKLIAPPPGFRGSTADRISTISREVKEMAVELNVPVIDISQLNRMSGDNGGDNEPTLDRLKDSGDVENDADKVLMLWRNKRDQEEGNKYQLLDAHAKLAKQRQGGLGRLKLKFAPDIYAFSSIEQLAEAEQALEEAKF
jgi:replicative DNA helicase